METLLVTRSGHSRASAGRLSLLVATTVAALLSFFASTEDAAAKDLKALAEFVIPAYTAMQFTMICTQDDPTFLRVTSGPQGTALHYAEHVKNEAIASLTNDEAVAILTAAADAARSIVRQELRKQAPNYPTARPGEITDWCRNVASSFVRAFIEQHDGRHALLVQEIERAKQ